MPSQQSVPADDGAPLPRQLAWQDLEVDLAFHFDMPGAGAVVELALPRPHRADPFCQLRQRKEAAVAERKDRLFDRGTRSLTSCLDLRCKPFGLQMLGPHLRAGHLRKEIQHGHLDERIPPPVDAGTARKASRPAASNDPADNHRAPGA